MAIGVAGVALACMASDIGVHGVTLACMAWHWRAWRCDWRGWRAMVGGRSIRKYTGTIREYRIASNEECMVPVTCGLYLINATEPLLEAFSLLAAINNLYGDTVTQSI